MSDKTATPIKTGLLRGNANLYRLSEPLEGHEHVIVSAVYDDFGGRASTVLHETYIFGADATGRIVDWHELNGSFKGGQDHAKALRRAGYEVAPS